MEAGARVRLRVGGEVRVGVRVEMRLAAAGGVRAGVGERVALELRGGVHVVVGAQASVCVVMVSLVKSRGHMAVCVCIGAVQGVAVCGSVRTGMWVTLRLQDCVGVCAVGVRAWTAAVRCLSIPVGGAAVVGRIVLEELLVFRRGAMGRTQRSPTVGG